MVVHAEPGSRIYAGLKPGTTRQTMAAGDRGGTVESLLHSFPARAGDCILIPAGTVHAIGAGVVLAEVQQMSDATFRLHDWGRVGPDGKPRQLHLAEALESIDFEAGPVAPMATTPEPIPGGTRERLSRSDYFALERLTLDGPADDRRPRPVHDRRSASDGEAEVRSGETSVTARAGPDPAPAGLDRPLRGRPGGRRPS